MRIKEVTHGGRRQTSVEGRGGDGVGGGSGSRAVAAQHLAVLPLECNLGGERASTLAIATALRRRGAPPVGALAGGEGKGNAEADAVAEVAEVEAEAAGELEGGIGCGCGACHPGSSGSGGRWWVLLDAAKAAASGPLHLPSSGADMAVVSFYKVGPRAGGCMPACLHVKV